MDDVGLAAGVEHFKYRDVSCTLFVCQPSTPPTPIAMPIPIFGEVYYNGLQAVPYLSEALKFVPWIFLIVILKLYFNGTRNDIERVMHGKVVIVTVRALLAAPVAKCG
jgi:hypothetical protein